MLKQMRFEGRSHFKAFFVGARSCTSSPFLMGEPAITWDLQWIQMCYVINASRNGAEMPK